MQTENVSQPPLERLTNLLGKPLQAHDRIVHASGNVDEPLWDTWNNWSKTNAPELLSDG